MKIESGDITRGFYFKAVDATDLKTPETGLSAFTVQRSRGGAAEAAMTTPTITEIDNTNCPGLYYLLCDEDMTITAGALEEAMAYHITCSGMAPVTREITLYKVPGSIRRGSTSTHGAQTITLAAESAPGLNFFAGCVVEIISGTGVDQARVCVSSTNANPPVLTLDRAWTVSLSGTVIYRVYSGSLATTAAEQADANLAAVVEDTETVGQQLKLIRAAAAGESDPSATATNPKYLSADGLTVRIDADVDLDTGKRTDVTVDVS